MKAAAVPSRVAQVARIPYENNLKLVGKNPMERG